MKREEVGVMRVVSPAKTIVAGRPADVDDIALVEEPVHVLEPVRFGIRVVEEDAPSLPAPEIERAGECQSVPDRGRALRTGASPWLLGGDGCKRPVEPALRVAADAELLGATGEVD